MIKDTEQKRVAEGEPIVRKVRRFFLSSSREFLPDGDHRFHRVQAQSRNHEIKIIQVLIVDVLKPACEFIYENVEKVGALRSVFP